MPTFVLIGHCGPDSYLLKNAISRAVPGAAIAFADDEDSLRANLNPANVLLINRVLDAGLAEGSGIELIERLAKSNAPPTMLLVSNFADAQQQAIDAGAMPGFGKRNVNHPHTAELLRAAARAADAVGESGAAQLGH